MNKRFTRKMCVFAAVTGYPGRKLPAPSARARLGRGGDARPGGWVGPRLYIYAYQAGGAAVGARLGDRQHVDDRWQPSGYLAAFVLKAPEPDLHRAVPSSGQDPAGSAPPGS
jgi:hypothetical protein